MDVCGRFVTAQTAEQLGDYFGAAVGESAAAETEANYNVAPTHDVLAVVAGANGMQVETFHWGLVPHWAKDAKIASSMINARGETIAQKPAFKSLLATKRCIIPMDGFYEWRTVTGGNAPLGAKGRPLKEPMFIYRSDGEPLAVAGLWAVWRDKAVGQDAPWLHSCTVITTAANDTMAPVHDRMPVILPRERWTQWLSPDSRDLGELSGMLVAAPNELLVMHAVSTDVNRVANNHAGLIVPTSAP